MNIRNKLTSIADLTAEEITEMLQKAEKMLTKYIKSNKCADILRGHCVAQLFFEDSTRTRNSFSLAAQRLGAMVLDPNLATSSLSKGESVLDTALTMEAMGASAIVMRHQQAGIAAKIAHALKPSTAFINAGDGQHQHPSQTLLDLLTISQHHNDWSTLKVAIVGDIEHSRVARSLVQALTLLGVSSITLIAPPAWLPEYANQVTVANDMSAALEADVICALRIQKERMSTDELADFPNFAAHYCLTKEHLHALPSTSIILHPGPVNWGAELAPEVAQDSRCKLLDQVTHGVAVRMAIFAQLLQSQA